MKERIWKKSGIFLCLLMVVMVILVMSLGGCIRTPRRKPTYPYHDDFSNPSTLSRYHKFDYRQVDNYQIVDGHLEIQATENQDLWGGDTGGGPLKRGAPLLLIDAPAGFYEAEAFVIASNTVAPRAPQALNTQVGLFVFRDIDNWMFFGFTNHNFTIDGETTVGNGLIATVTYNDNSAIHHEWIDEPDEDALYLKIWQYADNGINNLYQLLYKVNQNDDWIVFGEIQFPNPDTVSEEVGMGVKTFDLAGAGVSNMGLGLFDDFRVNKYIG